MLTKLSFKNAKRTFSDYAIYLLTVSVLIALVFMLNRLTFSPEIKNMAETSSGMQLMFTFASVVMLIIVYALIKYMTRFILNRRSKEFGLYQLMGIEPKRIKQIYWIEQCYLGAISMGIGIPVGLLIGEVLRSILFHIIGCIEYHFTIEGMGKTILLTILEIVVIYLLVKVTSRKLFKSRSILNWLQANRKNEKIRKNTKGRYLLTLFWGTLMIVSIVMLEKCLMSGSSISIVLCIGTLLLATFGFATCVIRIWGLLLLKDDKQFTMRVLPVRFVAKGIATKSKQMGILAILFVGSVGLLAVGLLFGNYVREVSKEYRGVDFYYTPDVTDGITDKFIEGMDEILKKTGVKDKYVCKGYIFSETDLYKRYESDGKTNTFISLTSYNRIRRMLGKDKISLKKDEFMIQAHSQLQIARKAFPLIQYQILGQKMQLKAVYIEPLNTQCFGNGSAYYAVVPDEYLKGLTPAYYSYAYLLKDKVVYKKLEMELLDYVMANSKKTKNTLHNIDNDPEKVSKNNYCLSDNFRFTQEHVQINAAGFAAVAISLLFMGTVFTLVLSTILAVLLTSEIGENRQRFLTLHRLGVAQKAQKKILYQQITSVFLFPVILGVPLAAAVCSIVGKILSKSMSVTFIAVNYILTIVVFLIVYIIYMAVTYKTICHGVINER
ncbi:bacitracin export permease protein BceB [Lachnospiraceae bacterium KM106-2]|nr:bacitracin export permease protein BceB [Lachnospiraceae bacterium KM106-2]